MKLLDTTPHLFTHADAVKIANELHTGDPDWTYIVVDDPKGTGYSRIVIHDETGEYVQDF